MVHSTWLDEHWVSTQYFERKGIPLPSFDTSFMPTKETYFKGLGLEVPTGAAAKTKIRYLAHKVGGIEST